MNEPRKLHENVEAAISGLESEYKIHDHRTFSSDIKSPDDFAAALGYPVQRITKTLFLRSHDGPVYAAAVCSADRRLDFKATAKTLGVKRVEAAPAEDLQAKTGYPRNGVSPLGLAAGIAVVVDRPLLDYPSVLVGGGATAVELELSPADLVRLCGATVASVTRPAGPSATAAPENPLTSPKLSGRQALESL